MQVKTVSAAYIRNSA